MYQVIDTITGFVYGTLHSEEQAQEVVDFLEQCDRDLMIYKPFSYTILCV